MRSGWLLLALAISAGVLALPGKAVSDDAYRMVREKATLTTPVKGKPLQEQFTALAGKVLELQGTINGTFTGADGTGFLLRLDGEQMVILMSRENDLDIALGNTVRVLAKVPQQGTVLESMSLMLLSAATPQPGAPGDAMGVDRRPPTVYNTQDPDYRPVPETPVVFTNAPTGLAKNPEVVQLYAQRIKGYNSKLDDPTIMAIAFHILDKSERYGVDPRLTMALVLRESRFNPRAVSPKGAIGLGQLMPGTAAGLGVAHPFDIAENLDGTAHYIANQLRAFGRLSHALAAYNAGPMAVRRFGGVPPYRETMTYVRLVWEAYADLAGLDPETGQQIAAR